MSHTNRGGAAHFVDNRDAARTQPASQQPSARLPNVLPRGRRNAAQSHETTMVARHRHLQADALKVPVPQPNLTRKPNSDDNPRDIAALARTKRGTFDDTQSYVSLESDLTDVEEEGQKLYSFGGADLNRGPRSNNNLRHVSTEHASQMRGNNFNAEEEQEQKVASMLRNEWQEELGEAKEFYGHLQPQYTMPVQATGASTYYDDNDYVDGEGNCHHLDDNRKELDIGSDRAHDAHTPTQPNGAVMNITDRAGHDNILGPWNGISKTTTVMGPPQKSSNVKGAKQPVSATKETTVPNRSTTPPVFDTKASSFVGSSSPSDEDAPLPKPATPTKKRTFEESLDYSPNTLKAIAYADLDEEPFLRDPRALAEAPVVDNHGVELTLEQKLTNMPKMQDGAIEAMFAGMDDAENEQTGNWMIRQMELDMKKLMAVRLKRREIASKYELMIKQREASVKAKTEDVNAELEGLKGGLQNLMQTGQDASAVTGPVDAAENGD